MTDVKKAEATENVRANVMQYSREIGTTREHTELLGDLLTALAAAKAEFPQIKRSKKNPFFESYYSSLEDVQEAVNPILAKHGLSIIQFPGSIGDSPALTTWLFHTSGQYIVETAALVLTKKDPQAHGSAITYMRRYSVKAILGLEDGEADDDGNAGTFENKKVNPKNDLDSARAEFKSAAKKAGLSSAEAKEWWEKNFPDQKSFLVIQDADVLREGVAKVVLAK